jgi:hypothetical protein
MFMTLPTHYKTKYGTKICLVCKKEYWKKHRTKKQWEESKCCSAECYHKTRIGIERPDAKEILAKNRLEHKGKKHWNWQGGITPENHLLRRTPEYNEWRKAVYKRDKYICTICNVKQKYPIAHHLKSFNEYPALRFEVNNGITVCMSCHKKIHKLIGFSTRF